MIRLLIKRLSSFFIFWLIPFITFGQNTIEMDSILIVQYNTNYSHAIQVINERNLADSLQGCPFFILKIGHQWFVGLNKKEKTIVYYFNDFKSEMNVIYFPNETEELCNTFSLSIFNHYDDKRYLDYKKYKLYYSYFVLFNPFHQKCFEWDNCTVSMNYEDIITKTLSKLSGFLMEIVIMSKES